MFRKEDVRATEKDKVSEIRLARRRPSLLVWRWALFRWRCTEALDLGTLFWPKWYPSYFLMLRAQSSEAGMADLNLTLDFSGRRSVQLPADHCRERARSGGGAQRRRWAHGHPAVTGRRCSTTGSDGSSKYYKIEFMSSSVLACPHMWKKGHVCVCLGQRICVQVCVCEVELACVRE